MILSESDEQHNVKRIRMRIKAPANEPCVLCPNDIPSEPLLPTEDGKQAHRMCAQYIPETIVEEVDKKEVVTGIKEISKARFDLKCNYCRSKKGACFQCSKKKCTRAYHATCAAAAGVFVEQGEIPVFGEDGTEYKEWGIEFSCRFHRIKRDKRLDSESLEEDDRIRDGAKELKAGEVCQMQFHKGDIFAGTIIENRKDEETVLVDILPRGFVEIFYLCMMIMLTLLLVTVLKSNINGFSFPTHHSSLSPSHPRKQSPCQNLVLRQRHSTPQNVKSMTFQELKIHLSRASHGQSLTQRVFLAMRHKSN